MQIFSSELTYQSLNGALPSRESSIKAAAKWRNSVYVLMEIFHQRSKWLGPMSNLSFFKKKLLYLHYKIEYFETKKPLHYSETTSVIETLDHRCQDRTGRPKTGPPKLAGPKLAQTKLVQTQNWPMPKTGPAKTGPTQNWPDPKTGPNPKLAQSKNLPT